MAWWPSTAVTGLHGLCFTVTKFKLSMMSRELMSSGVLQICYLKLDGPNCNVVIKVASFHIVHVLSRHVE